MVVAIKRVLGNDDNDVDVVDVVVIVKVVSFSEDEMVLALNIAKDAVDCVSIVEIIPEPICEVDVISGVVLVVVMDLDVGIVEDVKIVE